MSENIGLKPCPFCGSEPEAIKMTPEEYRITAYKHPENGCLLAGAILSGRDFILWNTRTKDPLAETMAKGIANRIATAESQLQYEKMADNQIKIEWWKGALYQLHGLRQSLKAN